MRAERLAALTAFAAALILAGCGGAPVRDGAPSGRIGRLPPDAVPQPEPYSRYGNGPVYEVLGTRYTVLPSADGYTERGVASWYGEKFHGRLTSSREVYDMYEMTAAHKTLPLPTYVRVRNLSNGRSIVVRVNDRGPFVHNRIIDLSYAAALRLDMVEDGTSLVEVTAITFDEPSGDRPVREITAAPQAASEPPAEPVAVQPEPIRNVHGERLFVQVGAFGDRSNAERRLSLLSGSGIANAFVHEDTGGGSTIFRVRIGPVTEVLQYDLLVEQLENLGIHDPWLVAE